MSWSGTLAVSRVDGVNGGVVVPVSWRTSRAHPLQSLGIVVDVSFGVARCRGLCVLKCPYSLLAFPLWMCPDECMLLGIPMYTP